MKKRKTGQNLLNISKEKLYNRMSSIKTLFCYFLGGIIREKWSTYVSIIDIYVILSSLVDSFERRIIGFLY